jgi:cellulose synthase/poly-beta-1,6-N-acetylglucosamine synthase-like glycosyltransferase
MEYLSMILEYTDAVLYVIIGLSVFYIFFFALISNKKIRKYETKIKKQYSIIVLVPAYKEDFVIERSVSSIIDQDYPEDKYDLVVIADKMQPETNVRLKELGAEVLVPDFQQSSKAKALNFAIETRKKEYDIVVILDADNVVEQDFLSQINKSYYIGSRAMQAHRIAFNTDTHTALLDAVSEEINNSIFRKGHIVLGLSSALIGSGMAFDYKWFCKNVQNIFTAGEDKELEILLLKERIFINYLEDVKVYDLKTQKDEVFYNQRRRWLAAQFATLKRSLIDFPKALFTLNYDYLDKIIQWMMLPRVILLGLICIISATTTIVSWEYSIKWWILLFVLILGFALAIPDYLVDKRLVNAFRKIPVLFGLMFLNLFRLKGVNNKFIHTQKN